MPAMAQTRLRAADDHQRHARHADLQRLPGKADQGAGASRRTDLGGVDGRRAGRRRAGAAYRVRPTARDRRQGVHRRFRYGLFGPELPAPIPDRRGQDRPQLRGRARLRPRRAGHERPAALLRGLEPADHRGRRGDGPAADGAGFPCRDHRAGVVLQQGIVGRQPCGLHAPAAGGPAHAGAGVHVGGD
ncbi:hypothetical protein G6F65_019525 [Rhizopus arrhizus]|nr:hypothetical protein G6F65_019525 [Rhizopus arrhizus]